jgi:protein-S-isoprenylcysteine O-methyltransferase Ste14
VEFDSTHLAVLAASWLGYFLMHSLLASLTVKQWFLVNFRSYFHWYRLSYNLFATILLIIPVWLTFSKRSELIIHWHGLAEIISWALTLLALVGFVVSASIYDGGHFLGLNQVKKKDIALLDQEQFRISWLHRYVRHPWYFLGLVLIWSRNMDIYQLLSTLMITLYLVFGSRLEEKKLVKLYGESYQAYCNKVPGLVPLPWKFLSKQQTKRLLEKQLGN